MEERFSVFFFFSPSLTFFFFSLALFTDVLFCSDKTKINSIRWWFRFDSTEKIYSFFLPLPYFTFTFMVCVYLRLHIWRRYIMVYGVGPGPVCEVCAHAKTEYSIFHSVSIWFFFQHINWKCSLSFVLRGEGRRWIGCRAFLFYAN